MIIDKHIKITYALAVNNSVWHLVLITLLSFLSLPCEPILYVAGQKKESKNTTQPLFFFFFSIF